MNVVETTHVLRDRERLLTREPWCCDMAENYMPFLRDVLIDQAIKKHNEGYNSITVILPISERNKKNFIHTEIEAVQNTLNFNVFGANIRIENCRIQRSDETAIVDVFITLLQVSPDRTLSNISESQVRVNRVINYEGNDLHKFADKIPKILAEDWSK